VFDRFSAGGQTKRKELECKKRTAIDALIFFASLPVVVPENVESDIKSNFEIGNNEHVITNIKDGGVTKYILLFYNIQRS
jgi:hypothetical protein